MHSAKSFYQFKSIQYGISNSPINHHMRKLSTNLSFTKNLGSETLFLVHALVRHANRTPDVKCCPPNDPNKFNQYYPYGPGQLTNNGKLNAYSLGLNLRRRYESFLKHFTPKIVYGRSTDYDRAQSTLQLILAGLFPPTGDLLWLKGLNWQPIKIEYEDMEDDYILSGFRFKEMKLKAIELDDSAEEFKVKYKHVFDYLSEVSGRKMYRFLDAFRTYILLLTEEEFGLPLPNWAYKIYPEPLKEMAILTYILLNGSKEIRNIVSGPLLKKILDDTVNKIQNPDEKKLYLYVGHEWNISSILIALDIYEPHIPPYLASLLFEIHKINSDYGIKIYYHDQTTKDPKLLVLPACTEFCSLDKFKSIVCNVCKKS